MPRTLMLMIALLLPLLVGCIGDAGEARFRGARMSFSTCTAICGAALTYDRGELTLELSDASGDVVIVNAGTLTGGGTATLASLEAALTNDAAQLAESECVGCDVEVEIGWVEGRLVTYDVESEPPAALADMSAFADALLGALATCTATVDVVPAAPCTPTSLP